MSTPVAQDLEGLPAERFRSLAAQLQRLRRWGVPAGRFNALYRDEIHRAASAPGLNGCREQSEASARQSPPSLAPWAKGKVPDSK
jgi:hypothetical protein